MKKLSVIVPVYNAEKVLRNTFDRLCSQSFLSVYPDDMEVIAVDDASRDNSLQMLREIEQAHPTLIRIIALRENRGPGGARNAGLDAAAGEYVGMVDADDLPDQSMFEKLWQASYVPSGDGIGSQRYDIVDSGVLSEAENTALHYTAPDLCGELKDSGRARLICEVGSLFSRIYRREFLDRYHIRFREHVIMEDQDFLCEVFARASSINAVPEALYFYRDTPDSASKRGAETSFFEDTIQTISATHGRLASLPNYEGIRFGAEFFYLYQCALAQGVIDAYREEAVITPEFADQMTGLLRRILVKTVRTPATNNPLILEKFSREEAVQIETLLQK